MSYLALSFGFFAISYLISSKLTSCFLSSKALFLYLTAFSNSSLAAASPFFLLVLSILSRTDKCLSTDDSIKERGNST